jgi:ATP-dependent Clp protease ATP-binding subunit ClpC
VGYEQGGQLTEALRKRPYQVVLLDEIEKAHPDVLNLLLQLFDEGRLTDGRGRVVDFSNALIVMTSNLGAHIFDKFCEEETRARIGFGGMSASAQFENQEALSEQVCLAAREHFTPELWNRMNEHLVFMPLTQDEVAQIAVLQLEDSNRRLQEESGISLDFSQEVILYLIQNGGYDRKFGARPMRHTIQRAIEGQLARLILSGELERGDTVFIDVDDAGELCFFAQEREASN